ncbi:MAG: CRISPR-associated ring nuclease [Candidatus Caldarchaeum sp.]
MLTDCIKSFKGVELHLAVLRCLATMGTSPPVVSEFVDYIMKTEKMDWIEILATSEQSVVESAVFAEAALRDRYPGLRVSKTVLDFSDILDESSNLMFMEAAAKTLARLSRGGGRVYVCLAGGRKEMVASLVLLAQLTDVEALYHVVAPDIKSINIMLEKIRSHISSLAQSSNPVEYYRQHKDVLEPVMYPPAQSYNVVRVPVLPYPSSYLNLLKQMLSQEYLDERRLKVDEVFLKRLRRAGLVRIVRNRVVVTDEGRLFYTHVLKHL